MSPSRSSPSPELVDRSLFSRQTPDGPTFLTRAGRMSEETSQLFRLTFSAREAKLATSRDSAREPAARASRVLLGLHQSESCVTPRRREPRHVPRAITQETGPPINSTVTDEAVPSFGLRGAHSALQTLRRHLLGQTGGKMFDDGEICGARQRRPLVGFGSVAGTVAAGAIKSWTHPPRPQTGGHRGN